MSDHAIANARGWLANIQEMVAVLHAARDSDDEKAQDDARQTIEESVLSVTVRDGWYSPGARIACASPEEYQILLTTGGPGLRIAGELDQNDQPDEWPAVQWQDWGIPWTSVELSDEEREAVGEFARCFYFGD